MKYKCRKCNIIYSKDDKRTINVLGDLRCKICFSFLDMLVSFPKESGTAYQIYREIRGKK